MNKRNSNNDQSSNNTAITTEDIFKKRWQKLHHPTMDVNGDVAFYYGVYKQFNWLCLSKIQCPSILIPLIA